MVKRNIVHIEIPAKDGKQSGEFYKKLFGWEIVHDEQMNYTMWEPQEGPGGGFSDVGRGAKVGEVLIHINSEDVDKDLEQAVALGASIVLAKTEIPGIGWYGIFKDPTGNDLALFQSMDAAG